MTWHSVVRRGARALALTLVLGRSASAQDAAAPGPESPARAEEPAPAVELPEQVVHLPAPGPTDATAAATVVDAARFEGEARAVAEIVASSPGVSVRDQGGLGQLATVSIRGASSDGVLVLLDGLLLNTAAGGGVDLSRIPRHWVSSIEVVRGAEGARWGAGALGGVLDVVTRPAGAGGGWSAIAGGGSFGTFTAGVDAAGGGDGWGAVAALSLDGSGGGFPYAYDALPSAPGGVITRTRTHNDAASGGLLAKGFLSAGGGRWDGLVQVSGGERSIPGDPYQDASPLYDRQRDGRVAAVVRHARPGPFGGLLSASLSVRADGLDLDAASPSFATRQRGLAAATRAEVSGAAGGAPWALGASAGGERLEGTGLDDPRARAELAAWAFTDAPLAGGRLRIAPALRAESIGPFAGLSGRLGMTLALGGPLSLRGGVGRTFRAPSFSELYLTQALLRPNPDLRPETAVGGDAALVAQGPLGLASAGAFASLYDDLVVYVPVSFEAYAPRNDARAVVRGVELEMASAPVGPARVQGQLAATLLDARTLRGGPEEVGKALPRRPGSNVTARLSAERGRLGGHLDWHEVGRQWLDTREIRSTPVANTLDAGLWWRLAVRPDARLHVEVRNLLDVRTLQDGFGNPLPGRMVMVTARVEGGRER